MQVKRISHATFTTPDVERQVDYYTNVLGLQVAGREPGRVFLANSQGLLAVVLEPGDAPRCTSLAFQVAPDTDLSEMRAELAKSGIAGEIQSDAVPGGGQRLVFDDPKKTKIEIFSRLDVLEESTKQSNITLQKLGHLAFGVVDIKGMTDWYVRILGFRVSDWRAEVFVFLRCGPDHHTVNFTLSHGGADKFHHIAFELKDWAEHQRALDFLGKNGYRMIWGPGRHLIGHNVFTYHRNPDGQIVELYIELDQMKDESLGYFEPRPWHQDHPQRPKVWPLDTLSNYWGAPSPPGFGD